MPIKLIFLIISLCSFTVSAEVIEAGGEFSRKGGAVGTTNQVCLKKDFIKRNSGAMATGLTASNLKIYRAVESTIDLTSGTEIEKFVNFNFGFAASTGPALPGVYTLCIKPKGFVWQPTATYQIHILINGTTASDNGSFEIVVRS
jgi:hypothetical protein